MQLTTEQWGPDRYWFSLTVDVMDVDWDTRRIGLCKQPDGTTSITVTSHWRGGQRRNCSSGSISLSREDVNQLIEALREINS